MNSKREHAPSHRLGKVTPAIGTLATPDPGCGNACERASNPIAVSLASSISIRRHLCF